MPRTVIPIIEEDEKIFGPLSSEEEAVNFVGAVRRASSLWKKRLRVSAPPLGAEADGALVRISASKATGVVPVGAYELNIIPKYLTADPARTQLWSTALLRMLSFSSSSKYIVVDDVSTQSSPAQTFIDLLARSYASALATAVSEGVPRGYHRHASWQPVLRGRLLVGKLYPSVLTAPHKLPCEYDEFVPDTPVTRLLKWAAVEFSRMVTRSSLSDRLLSIAALLPGVTAGVPSTPALDRLTLSPQYRHCEPAMRIALWLARGKGGRYGDGESEMPGVLINSATVFENFVIEILKRVCLQKGWEFRRAVHTLAVPLSVGDKVASTEPDAQVWIKGRIALVVDAKYKSWRGKPTPEDTYQIMAGGRVLDCQRVVLLYPSPERAHPHPIQWRVQGRGRPESMYAAFVDPILMADPDGVRKITGTIGEEFAKMLRA